MKLLLALLLLGLVACTTPVWHEDPQSCTIVRDNFIMSGHHIDRVYTSKGNFSGDYCCALQTTICYKQ